MNTDWIDNEDRNHPAWDSFCLRMKDKQYGPDPTLQAWCWYKDGYQTSLALDTLQPKTLEQVTLGYMQLVYQRFGGNVARTALALGVDRRTLYRKGVRSWPKS